MINKIIILVEQYFTGRDYNRYGIDILKSNGLEVFVWDLSKIFAPETIDALNNTFIMTDYSSCVRFNSIKDVMVAIKKTESSSFFISTITYNYKSLRIFRYISKKGFKYGCTGPFTVGVFPPTIEQKPKYWMLEKVIKKDVLGKVFGKIFRIGLKIPPRIYGINYATYFPLAGGSFTKAIGPLINNNTFIQHIHAIDYDAYLGIRSSFEKTKNNKFVVFIDQYLPYHPDGILLNDSLGLIPEKYYEELRNYFDYIETLKGCEVVVAAHPKAQYQGKEFLFGNRKIFSNFNSAEIISKSKFVIMHYSTAINLAVLFKKPILFITNDKLNSSNDRTFIDALVSWFNTVPVNVNEKKDYRIEPVFDTNRYDSYIEKYIKKKGTKEELFWKQVADFVKGKIA